LSFAEILSEMLDQTPFEFSKFDPTLSRWKLSESFEATHWFKML
jgi:hypothetical protein